MTASSTTARTTTSGLVVRSRRARRWLTSANLLLVTGLVVLVVLLLIGLLVSLIAPSDPITMNVADALKPPSADHWLGTDRFGRDVFSRILWGTRGSLLVSFASVTVAVIIGSGLGIVGGYYQGPIDMVLSRLMDILFGFPSLLLAITIAAMLGPSAGNVVVAI